MDHRLAAPRLEDGRRQAGEERRPVDAAGLAAQAAHGGMALGRRGGVRRAASHQPGHAELPRQQDRRHAHAAALQPRRRQGGRPEAQRPAHARLHRAAEGQGHRRRPDDDRVRGAVHAAPGPAQPELFDGVGEPAGRHAARPAVGRGGHGRREGEALDGELEGHDGLAAPHAHGRHSARGRHRLDGRLRPAARAGAVRAGRHPGRAGAEDRDVERCEVQRPADRDRQHRTRQACRPAAGGR
ncbi:unnamed protein product [Rotaria sp. Silwood1]|nr:unnamed protein product [Rotaria sp. Silwood1]